MRTMHKGLDYIAAGMGWNLDGRNKIGKLWRIKHGHPFHILVEKLGYTVIKDQDYGASVLMNPKDGSYVVLGCGASDYPMTGNFMCDKVRAKKYGLVDK